MRNGATRNRFRALRAFSMVEAMVGVAVFAVVAMSIAGVHQKLGNDATKAHLADKSLEYMSCEVDRLNRLARLPERDGLGNLIYRDASNNVVNSGGSLVPYGYNDMLVSATNKLNSADQTVTYPDVLENQTNLTVSDERVQLKRRYAVQIVNAGQADEYKKITITLSDAETPARIKPVQQDVIIKKVNAQALDTRMAAGTASLSGTVVDKVTGKAPTQTIYVTLTPSDQTAPRLTQTDEKGNFYFAPPLNPKITYTLTLQGPGGYWSRTDVISISPGVNTLAILGNSPGYVQISPLVFANAAITVRNGDTNALMSNVPVVLYHNGTPPESCPASYNATTDASGVANFRIQIPTRDSNTYGSYYVALISYSGFISVDNPSDKFLALNRDVVATRNYSLYTQKKGSAIFTVKNSAGILTPYAKVFAYLNANYTGLADSGQTDSRGQITLSNLPINSIASPTQTSRTFYIQTVSPAHIINNLVIAPALVVNTETPAEMNIDLLEHKLNWADNTSVVGVNVGFTNSIYARAFYEGHQGPLYNDIVAGPNLASYVGQSLTADGYAATTYDWSGWDSGIITVQNGATKDQKTIVGVSAGTTKINVTATYSFSWSGTPYTLSKTRTYTVTVLNSGTLMTPSITPTTSMQAPDTNATYASNLTVTPTDVVYTWSVTGDGVASYKTVNSSLSEVPNGTNAARYLLVRSGPTLMNTFTITLTAQSSALGQTNSTAKTVTVNYSALAVTLSPSGTVNMQPGYTTALVATASGGSGLYSYTWTLRNPTTGDIDTVIGSLSATNVRNTIFTAAQIGSVNASMHVVDTQSGRFVDAATLFSVQPAGGVSGDGENK